MYDFDMDLGFGANDAMVLTGAGYTKNFGGFLAKEMWSHIFNSKEVQSNPNLKLLLLDNYDYESVYSSVLEEDKYTDEEKAIINEVVRRAYKLLDDSIRDWVFSGQGPYPVNRYLLGDLFVKTLCKPGKQTLFFTLNQDLFMERKFGFPVPGVKKFSMSFSGVGVGELRENQFTGLPSGDSQEVEGLFIQELRSHNGIHYIKLHGSYGWRSSDGSDQLVIGSNKESLIQKEPLLRCYFELFKQSLFKGDQKLLVIGYGFRDVHINKILLEAIQKYDLKLYVITTQSPEDLKSQFEHGHYYAKDIMNGFSGYFPYRLKDIFPGDQSYTVQRQQIIDSLS